MEAFAVLAEPTRRRILQRLQHGTASVGELARVLELGQPAVSKHLKVLRDAGFVSRRGDAQLRIYRLEAARFRELDAWLAPYRKHLDATERPADRAAKRDHET